MATMTEIKFECTNCSQRLLVNGDAAGMEVTCPGCATKMRVPHASTVAAGDRAERKARPGLPGSGVAGVETMDLNSMTDEAELIAEIRRVQAQLAEARAEIEKVNASATHGQAEIKSFQSERLSLKSELSQLRQKLAAAENQLRSDAEAWHAETTRLEAENAEFSEHFSRGQAEIEAMQIALREHEIEASEARGRLDEVQAERVSAFREIETLRQKVGLLESELVEAKVDRGQFLETAEKLRETEAIMAASSEKFSAAQRRVIDLESEADELNETASRLRQNLKKGEAGKELLLLQGQHAELKAERESLAGQVRQLTADLKAQETTRDAVAQEARELRQQLDAALKQAEAQSESRLRADNDVLRGIVTRQNSELEQRHVQLVRLKRARIALRLVYALFGLGFILLGIFAVKFIPALRF